jgi:hypothetical protein
MTNHSGVIQPPNTSQQSIHIPPTQKKKKKTQTGNGERNSTLNKVGRAYEETNAKSKQGLEIGRGEPTYSAALNPKLRLLLLFLSIVFKQNNNLRCFPLMLSNQTCGQCGKKTQTLEVKLERADLPFSAFIVRSLYFAPLLRGTCLVDPSSSSSPSPARRAFPESYGNRQNPRRVRARDMFHLPCPTRL